jgi:hypothetical protein
MPKPLGPEIGNPHAGLAGGRRSRSGPQVRRWDPDVPTDAGHQGPEGDPRGAEGGPVLQRPLEPGDKLAAPEEPLVPLVGLPAPAELGENGGRLLPAARDGPQEGAVARSRAQPADLARRTGSVLSADEIAVVNGLAADARLMAGQLIKVAIAEHYRDRR